MVYNLDKVWKTNKNWHFEGYYSEIIYYDIMGEYQLKEN